MSRNKRYRTRIAALAGALMLAGAGTTGTALAAEFTATLSGNALVAGDPDGWGRVKIDVGDSSDRLCADVEVRSIGRVTAVQIHRGAAGTYGPPVVNLDRPDDEDSDDCDTVGDALADDIQANPGGFYVMVRTDDHPAGALRGQLGPSSD